MVDDAASVGIAISPVHTFEQAAQMAHLAQRDMLQNVELEDGSEAPIVGPTAKFSRTPTAIRSAAPALGQHNHAILAEVGYSAEEIELLSDAGVI